MGRGVVGLDERLMARLERRRRAGQGELVVIQPPLTVEMGRQPIQRALALGAADGLLPDLPPRTDRLNVGRRRGPATAGAARHGRRIAQTGGTRGPAAPPRWLRWARSSRPAWSAKTLRGC